MGATANYVDNNWEYQSTHLTLKMVAWWHFGVLLARPIGRFLIRHGLHKKMSPNTFSFIFSFTSFLFFLLLVLTFFFFVSYMLAQTTDSGGNNGPMAHELQQMFLNTDDPVSWYPSTHHVRCFAHKLNLVVGHGLKALGQQVGHLKHSTL